MAQPQQHQTNKDFAEWIKQQQDKRHEQ